MKPNREQLLGFLLDALDDVERDKFEQHLSHDPQLQRELESLQSTLEPLSESYAEFEPPPTLAERTCALVTGHANAEKVSLARPGFTHEPMSGSAPSRFSLADMFVAAGIFLAAALLFFPVIQNSRFLARQTHCENNLSHLGLALASYSDKDGGGFYPCVPTAGKFSFAGVYALILRDNGYLQDPTLVLCPSSDLAQQPGGFRMPTLEEVDQASRMAIADFRRIAGGSYGYNLGFVVDGRHHWPRNQGRTHFALMADAPNSAWMDLRSLNHGGRGQNLLFGDGHVRFVVECVGDGCLDHPFQNHFGRPEAGVNENDSVIGSSFWSPFQQPISRRDRLRSASWDQP